ncbi:uncharacterized protein METZ01_LOCUS296679, partial [marine metagenome]
VAHRRSAIGLSNMWLSPPITIC